MTIAQQNQQFGTFRLEHLVGSGSMGEVWAAQDTSLSRRAAVKVLYRHVAPTDSARLRLIHEVELARKLSHPAIARLHAVGRQNGHLFIASEFVEGVSFATPLETARLSDYDAVRMVRDLAEALAEAHAHGIVHRDIKPGNIRVSEKRVKLLDLGSGSQVADSPIVTTLEYMSPELVMGKEVDGRTDIFSLGVVLYRALTGTLPFTAPSVMDLLLRICREEPRPFDQLRPDLPDQMAVLIAKCLKKDRDRRFNSAVDLVQALDHLLPRLARLPLLPVAARPAPSAGRRILIVDDDIAARRLFQKIADHEGIECDTAANGWEAIAALRQHEYGMVFLDIMMPRIDGWGVLDYLRSRATGQLPSVFVITASLGQSLSAADAQIAAGIIYKPLVVKEIVALVRQCGRGIHPAAVLKESQHRLVPMAG